MKSFLDNIADRLSLVTLTGPEYSTAIKASSALGVVGGTIYDAVLAKCAMKANAETWFTWNLRHWQHLGPEASARVRTP